MGSTAAHRSEAEAGSVGTELHLPAMPETSDEPTVITKSAPGDLVASIVPAPPHERSKLLAGEKLGPYELLEFAGGGGMGAVFRARDPMLNRDVAVKVLSRDQASDDETLRRFQNEAQSAARLDHQNIARVYYVGEDRGLHFIVFEFVEGLNVRQLVEKQGPLPLDDAVSYTLQVADALAHASTRDIVHRDIKPSNILITADGKAKLVDMGLARWHGIQPGEDLTASGVTLGTFDYISPEQARDPRMADVRSDIYSLGCTFYFMLTGRPPFPEGTVLQKLLQHNSDDPIDPREYNPHLPEAVTNVLRKMLAKEPQRRYQSPGDLIADLLHLGDQIGLGRTELRLSSEWSVAADDAPSVWARQVPWLVPLAVLLSLAAALQLADRRAERQLASGLVSVGTPVAPERAAEAKVVATPTAPQASSSTTGAAATGTAANPAATSIAGAAPAAVPAISPTSSAASAVAAVPVPSATSSPAMAAPEPAVPAARDGVLIVCDDPSSTGQYTSLRAACFAAKNGDVIELCYDGEKIERPLTLNNQKLTIRAGEGFRPAVVFRPAEAPLPNMPTSMIGLLGGRLALVGVELSFVIPPPQELPADQWSLFDLQDQESLKLERCDIVVKNDGPDGQVWHQNTAVFTQSVPPGNPAAMMNMPAMPEGAATQASDPAEIRLDHCIVRGETRLLHNARQQAVVLQWNNGVAVLAQSLLSVEGGQMPLRDVEVRVELRHLTALCGGAAVRISAGFDAPFLPNVAVNCTDSILATNTAAPLVTYDGIDAQAELLNSFQWTAERVFYEGFKPDAFWRLDSPVSPSQWLTIDDWRARWGTQREVQTAWGGVRWRRSLGAATAHRFSPSDLRLDESSPPQRALRGAADGSDVGCMFDALPPAMTVRLMPDAAKQSHRAAATRAASGS